MMTQQLHVVTTQPVAYCPAVDFDIFNHHDKQGGNLSAVDSLAILAGLDEFTLNPVIDTWINSAPCVLPKQFLLMTKNHQICFKISEESQLLCRACCPLNRPFAMYAQDSTGRMVFGAKQSTSTCCRCSPFCQSSIAVEMGERCTELGSIREARTCVSNVYHIYGADNNLAATIQGPSCMACNSCSGNACWPCRKSDIIFRILSDDTEIGEIRLVWTNWRYHCFVPTDPYEIKFISSVDVRLKVLVIGAIFLIDFRHFERNRCRKCLRTDLVCCCLLPCSYPSPSKSQLSQQQPPSTSLTTDTLNVTTITEVAEENVAEADKVEVQIVEPKPVVRESEL